MIKLSYNIKNYREDLLNLVSPGDDVIELGCHVGGTTKLLPKDCNVIAIRGRVICILSQCLQTVIDGIFRY